MSKETIGEDSLLDICQEITERITNKMSPEEMFSYVRRHWTDEDLDNVLSARVNSPVDFIKGLMFQSIYTDVWNVIYELMEVVSKK